MRVTVKLFAAAKEQAGQDALQVELPASATVGDLRTGLAVQFPALASLASRLLFAVDHQYVTDGQRLAADAEIAGFPPVSGG